MLWCWSGKSISSAVSLFLFFIMNMAHFSVSNSIPTFFLFVSGSTVLFFYKTLYNIRWLIFSCDFVIFLSTWLSDIIALMNICSKREYSWKMPAWTFTIAKVFSFIFQLYAIFFHEFRNKVNFFYILFIFRDSIIHFCKQYQNISWSQSTSWLHFLCQVRCCNIYIYIYIFLHFVPLQHPYGNSQRHANEDSVLLSSVRSGLSTSKGNTLSVYSEWEWSHFGGPCGFG